MSRRREFEIAFVGLKPGVHEFSYSINDKFFEAFQQQDFRHCKANVKLSLDKKSSFMLLKFEIGGNLEVTCDRCNNNLPWELWDEFNITVKMVEDPEVMNEQEEDPDMYYIGQGESHCNKTALDMLKKMEPEENKQKENPIWKGLEKFKDLESE